MHGVDYYEMAVLGFTPALKHRPLMQSLKEPGPGSGYRRYIANDIAPQQNRAPAIGGAHQRRCRAMAQQA